MDLQLIRDVLNTTLEEVAFKKDANGTNISIIAKAEENLKSYLEQQTSITDDEKARRYAEFLTTTITSVVTQAIQVAGEAPLRDAQIGTELQRVASMQVDDTNKTNETNQKITSMQNEDKARLNETASKVARTKFEIETLLPAQVATEQKRLEVMDKDILIKQAQANNEVERLNILQAETSLKQKDQQLRDKEIAIKDAMASVELEKVPLIRYQAENERIRTQLTGQQIGLTQMEVQYKLAQIKAIQEAAQTNKEIEKEKNETQLKIAELYALR